MTTALIPFERGNRLKAEGVLDQAVAAYQEALRIDPGLVDAYNNLGTTLLGMGQLDQAAETLRQALRLAPNRAEIHFNLGSVQFRRESFEAAAEAFGACRALRPDLIEASTALGGTLARLGRHDEAILIYRGVTERRPEMAEPWSRLGALLTGQGRLAEARAVYAKAFTLFPAHPKIGKSYGDLLAVLGLLEDAVAVFRQSLAHCPGQADTLNNLGDLLYRLGRLSEAADCFGKAAVLSPARAELHNNLAGVLLALKRSEEAAAAYRQAIALRPDFALALNGLAHASRLICDWSDLEAVEQAVRRGIAAGAEGIAPYHFLTLSSTAEEQRIVASRHAAKIRAAVTLPPCPHPAEPKRRLHVGYLSADLHPHPSTYLLADLIDHHDRSAFEVSAYSLGPVVAGELRDRLVQSFDHFVELGGMTAAAASQRLRDDQVDILVDLQGYTFGARPEILAARPAPIQVNFLGHPGTMGADFVDYIIGDEVLIPLEHESFYGEAVVRLPHCYQPNAPRPEIIESRISRAQAGLPENATVLCCFNHTYKISPAVFRVWMRILAAQPGTVLWLLDDNPAVTRNLRREAAEQGVSPDRLIFAPRVSKADYLGRFTLADLFLDTLPYNAGATCSDALWAGLPILTCLGETYVGRMAGSMLTAIGLPELVTRTLDEYQSLALELAGDPRRLAEIRARLADNRATSPLFDIAGYARHLEGAYGQMWAAWLACQPPRPITIAAP